MFFSTWSQEATWTTAVFAVFALAQLFFLFRFWIRVAVYKSSEKNLAVRSEPVSVIICARFEAENLKKNLEHFLTQDYPNFEVIVVNDSYVEPANHDSIEGDGTQDVLAEFQARYPKILRVTDARRQDKYPKDKKFALTIGIKAAKNNILILSDADCRPASDQWLRLISRRYLNQTAIVLGFGGYKQRNSLLNWFIQYDTLLTGLNCFSFALAGQAYMGVGRNLSYLKTLFMERKGFAEFIHHPCGDDDLFVNKAATSANVNWALEPDSFTYSEPETTWINWFKQKQRHLIAGRFYHWADLFWLAWGSFSFWGCILAFLLSIQLHLNNQEVLQWLIPTFTSMVLLRWYMMGAAAVKFKMPRLIFLLPFFEIIYPILRVSWALKPFPFRQR